MNTSNQLPTEAHAAIYSISLIIIFKLVGNIFSGLPKLIGKEIYQSFIIFLTGLCIRDKNQSANGFAKFFGIKSHDALTRMLTHKCWSASRLMLELLDQAIQLSTGLPTQSWLILDDVILPKHRSRNTEGVSWDWDYIERKHILCMRVVVLAWSNGIVCIPVAFAFYFKRNSTYLRKYNKKFRTKNQLARALVYHVLRRGLQFDYLLFDSWYANAKNFNLFDRLNIKFVTALNCNRKLRLPFFPLKYKPKRKSKNDRWYEFTCSQWADQKPYVRDYHMYKKVGARARKQPVFLKNVNFLLKMVCIKNYANNKNFKEIHTTADKRAKDPNKYLLTNDLNLTIPQIISLYRKRWTIEVMFRDCKQHFALGKCQAHKSIEPHLRHTAMVFFAFALVELIKSDGKSRQLFGKSCGHIINYLQNQQLVHINSQYHVVDISRTYLDWNKINILSKVIDLNEISNRETQLVLNLKC